MMLKELLRKNKDAIVQKWLDDILATYPGTTAVAFKQQEDPFANPVGHSLRVGTRAIVEALIDGMEAGGIRRHLQEIIRIRAVQQFSASEAVSFVFHLKEVVRAQLGKAASDPQLISDLAEFEGRVDRVGLAAFDVFVECREQVCELRVNELKRRVSWVAAKMNERGRDDGAGSAQPGARAPGGTAARHEGSR